MEALVPAAHRLVWLSVVLSFSSCVTAQQTAQQTPATQKSPGYLEDVPRVPGLSTFFSGMNLGVTYSGVHSSSIGWYEVASPALSYAISSHYSADASMLIYLHRLVQDLNSGTQSSQRLAFDLGDTGDTLIGFHGTYHPDGFYESFTASMTAPTGDRSAGLGTGQVTFDFNSFTEHYVKQTGFLLNLGIGDSSALASDLVTQNYNSVGKLAHFQAGSIIWLRKKNYVQSIAYEDLPVGSQTVYKVLSSPNGGGGEQPGGEPTNVVTSTSASEDNGLITQAGIPLTDHLALSGYYQRSLRQHQDTVSIGMTWVLRSSTRPRKPSLIDRALRVAAGVDEK